MPNGDPRDGFFYPILTLMIDSYYHLVDDAPPIGGRLMRELLVSDEKVGGSCKEWQGEARYTYL